MSKIYKTTKAQRTAIKRYLSSEKGKISLAKTQRKLNLKNKYNLSMEDYEHLLSKQNNTCAGCLKSKDQFKRHFAVDHCHKTGKIRGLLCVRCNVVLGQAKDDIETLKRLIEYLESHK